MKLVNPVGRNVSFNADNDEHPLACMCRTGLSYSGVRSSSDNCSHCGCNCFPWNYSANSSVAVNTDRSSAQ